MELHERISNTRHRGASDGRDPFSDLKNRIHLALIGDLGPQLFALGADPSTIQARVAAEIRQHLQQEAGLSRDDRERLESEIADDVLGYGPLERLLADESVSEIMVNGPHEIWVERQGRLYAGEERVHAVVEAHDGGTAAPAARCFKAGSLNLDNAAVRTVLTDKRNLALLSELAGSGRFTPEESRILAVGR